MVLYLESLCGHKVLLKIMALCLTQSNANFFFLFVNLIFEGRLTTHKNSLCTCTYSHMYPW